MKRKILALLLASLLVFLMSSCGRNSADTNKDEGNDTAATEKASPNTDSGDVTSDDEASVDETTPSESDEPSADNDTASSDNSSGGIFKTEGTEFTDFDNAFTGNEKVYSDLMSSAGDTMEELNAGMAIAIADLDLAMLCEYDLISGEGKLMLSQFDATKDKKGSKINFSATYTYDAESTVYKEGDKLTEGGVLDTASNVLSFESKVERDGSVIERTVLEAVVLPDGTYLMSYYKINEARSEGETATTSAVFKRFNNSEYKAVYAEFDPNFDFTYDSIIGKGDISVDDMAKNYTVKGTYTVKDGQLEYK